MGNKREVECRSNSIKPSPKHISKGKFKHQTVRPSLVYQSYSICLLSKEAELLSVIKSVNSGGHIWKKHISTKAHYWEGKEAQAH